jgi:hypothetical protein
MADAVAFVEPLQRVGSRSRTGWNFQLALDLVIPAVLLGLLRLWSLTAAPKQGLYFTAELILIAYAYFAVARGAYLTVGSCDREGRYDPARAQAARLSFYGALLQSWRGAWVLLPLLAAALALDALTAQTGIQHRPNVHLSMLFVAFMVWARYGAAVILAAARWSPPAPPAFAEARELAGRLPAVTSFATVTIAFCAVALVAIVAYKWAGAALPTARAEHGCLIVLFTLLAWLALWLNSQWAAHILPRLAAFERAERPAVTRFAAG